MIRLFWVLLAMISLSWFALDLMLERPVSVTNNQVSTVKTGEGQLKPFTRVDRKLGSLADFGKNQDGGEPSHQLDRVSTPKSLTLPSEEGPPELFTPSGFPVAELEEIDILAIEDRLSEEQLVDSYRDPGYFFKIHIESYSSTGLDLEENNENGPDPDSEAELVEEIEVSDIEVEEEMLKMSEVNAPETNMSSADGDKPEEHLSNTESGLPIDSAAIDYNEIEERIYNAQLEESQRGPVY